MRIKAILAIIAIGFILYPTVMSPKYEEAIIKIDEGDNLNIISRKLKEAGIIQDRIGFKLMVVVFKKSTCLSYGWYKFKKYEEPEEILKSLIKGRRLTVKVAIQEGLKVNETIYAFRRHKDADIDISKMKTLVEDTNFIKALGINQPTMEGYLFPDTYIFYKGEKPENIIRKMVSKLFEVVKPSQKFKIKSMEFSAHEILTIASMVEREAMVDREKPIIASVIYNRLEKNMPLQIDATVIYALGMHKTRVMYKDLRVKSPYNTYRNRGLPPGPIASPGFQSIMAALHPSRTNYLYYVATGKGDHIFSETYKEHVEAKKKVRN
ncbi:endolytic transglycosylase MltG [candidate division WOR-3 bacterium]|nr:endolytic transglycosylase MltG [candidate division WOR-3 bacterium]